MLPKVAQAPPVTRNRPSSESQRICLLWTTQGKDGLGGGADHRTQQGDRGFPPAPGLGQTRGIEQGASIVSNGDAAPIFEPVMKNLSHVASFHFREKIAPSNYGIST